MAKGRHTCLPITFLLDNADRTERNRRCVLPLEILVGIVRSVLFLKNLGPGLSSASLLPGGASFGLLQSLFPSPCDTFSFMLVAKSDACGEGGADFGL